MAVVEKSWKMIFGSCRNFCSSKPTSLNITSHYQA